MDDGSDGDCECVFGRGLREDDMLVIVGYLSIFDLVHGKSSDVVSWFSVGVYLAYDM